MTIEALKPTQLRMQERRNRPQAFEVGQQATLAKVANSLSVKAATKFVLKKFIEQGWVQDEVGVESFWSSPQLLAKRLFDGSETFMVRQALWEVFEKMSQSQKTGRSIKDHRLEEMKEADSEASE